MNITHGSLFTGIGGFDLAAEWAGIETTWQIESNSFCQGVLKKHFPKVKLYGDIRDVEKKELEKVDIISAGPPCQPASVSGNRRGQKDDRWLWHEVLAVVEHVQPRWIILENPVGIASLGEPEGKYKMEYQKISRTAESDVYEAVYSQREALFLPQFIKDLEEKGYKLPELKDGTPVIPVIPACSVGAPHRRDRVWIVAYSSRIGLQGESWGEDVQLIEDFHAVVSNSAGQGFQDRRIKTCGQKRQAKQSKRFCRTISNPNGRGCEGSTKGGAKEPPATIHDMEKGTNPDPNCQRFQDNVHGAGVGEEAGKDIWEGKEFAGMAPNYWGNWSVEPQVGRVAHGVPDRMVQIKALGNTIVPQIAYVLFEAIKCVENLRGGLKQ